MILRIRKRLIAWGQNHDVHYWRWRALTLWIIFFTIALLWIYGSVQSNRREGCRNNYAALRAVIHEAYRGATSPAALKSESRVLQVASGKQCEIISVPFWAR